MYTIMSFANNDNFASSFSIWMNFISFSYPISVGRTSNFLLNRSSENWHTCLVPDLTGKALYFCPLSIMLAVGLSYMAFIMLRNAPSVCTLLSFFSFYHKWVLYLIKSCFHLYLYDQGICLFFFCCLYDVLHLLMCQYCAILASLGWITLGHGLWYF